MEIKKHIIINEALNLALYGRKQPSPIDKSIGRQFKKNKKLKKTLKKVWSELWK